MADKGWSREECRNRYVHGPRIGLRGLAEISHVPYKTLAGWSAEESWPEQRNQFQGELRTQTDKKVKEKLSMSLAELAIEHFGSYRRVRRIADSLLSQIEAKVMQLESNHPELVDPEQIKESLRELFEVSNVSNINQLSLILDRAVQGERTVTGAEYEDLQKAANVLRRRGFDVVVADGTDIVTIKSGQKIDIDLGEIGPA